MMVKIKKNPARVSAGIKMRLKNVFFADSAFELTLISLNKVQ
jgi:hypothetical protein